MVSAAVTTTMADRLEELGHISPGRLRLSPPPGTATIDDLTLANTHSKPLCELIDQSLVEKAVGFEAAVVAAAILSILHNFVSSRRLGIVSGADGMFELLPGTVRAPDIAFVSTEQLPGGRFPRTAFPAIAPDLVVEVLSPGNTKTEMSRKPVEYFHLGVGHATCLDGGLHGSFCHRLHVTQRCPGIWRRRDPSWRCRAAGIFSSRV